MTGEQLSRVVETAGFKTDDQEMCETKCSTPKDLAEESKKESEDAAVNVEIEDKNGILFDVFENPSVPYSFMIALQQAATNLVGPYLVSFLVVDIVCARKDEILTTKIVCTSLFMSGLCTFLQSTVGIRLPIFQGPMPAYVVSLLALKSLPEWKCNDQSDGTVNDTEHASQPLSSYVMLQKLEGSLMIAGVIHALIGIFGITGILVRFIGPVTIAPTLTVLGLFVYPAAVNFAETQWGVAFLTATIALILAFYLAKYRTPVPWYNRSNGFFIRWCNTHRTFAVMISLLCGWFVSWIITMAGGYDTSPDSLQYYARTDSHLNVLYEAKWFNFPYPGQYGAPSYETGALVAYLVTTVASIFDSVGDYYACIKVIDASPPPKHALNRGIAIDGFITFISGWAGAGHGTSTYGNSVSIMAVTGVLSLRVFQVLGLLLMVLGVCGKVGAIFVMIPYPVLGGLLMLILGVFIGESLAYVELIDISSRRNMSIIGISIFLPTVMNHWISTRENAIATGIKELDYVLTMIVANPIFISCVVACFLDNTMPGTRKQRGLCAWNELLEAKDNAEKGEQVDKIRSKKLLKTIYVIPYFNKVLKRFPALGYLSIFPKYDATADDQSSSPPMSTKF